MAVKGHAHTAGFIPVGGYAPTASQTRLDVRATGNMPLLTIDEIKNTDNNTN
jgi:hypothetical protein